MLSQKRARGTGFFGVTPLGRRFDFCRHWQIFSDITLLLTVMLLGTGSAGAGGGQKIVANEMLQRHLHPVFLKDAHLFMKTVCNPCKNPYQLWVEVAAAVPFERSDGVRHRPRLLVRTIGS